MSAPAICIEGLSKEYRIGARQQHSTFYDLLSQALSRPVARIGRKAEKVERNFWALRAVSFDVQPGDVLGIIGRNGAGKSTLLKILSRITEPTEGKVTIRGRVASLLEVGTGFHPELTGRENVFLNGAILGMKQREIGAKFDEIVDFAEVEKFIDTPVKRYSSGMLVRLAFAVAAHLDPDVLIADEVLAVGDAAFQKKSLGKMGEAARGGRTVLFVSHNLGAVRILCRSAVVLEAGRLTYHGPVEDGVSAYERGLGGPTGSFAAVALRGPLSGKIAFESIEVRQDSAVVTVVNPLREFEIEIRGAALRRFQTLDLNIAVARDGVHLSYCHDSKSGTEMREGSFTSRFRFPAGTLKPGRYTFGVGALAYGGDWIEATEVFALDVSESWGDESSARDRGPVKLHYSALREQ